jgi:hypothetical protein
MCREFFTITAFLTEALMNLAGKNNKLTGIGGTIILPSPIVSKFLLIF